MLPRENNKSEVVNLTNEILHDLIKEKPTNYETVVAIAAESANDLLMFNERDRFLKELQTFPNSKALMAVYDFIVQVNQESLKKTKAVEKLYGVYKEGHKHDQILAQQFVFSPYTTKAKDIVELLSKYVDQILQPSSKEKIDEDHIFSDLDLIKSVYDPSTHLFYTDDAISRLYVCGEDHFKDTISTIDIIAILRDCREISEKEAAEKYARLCGFNVIGAPIDYKDILIVLESDLPIGKSIEDNLDILKNHQNFNSFINGIWWSKGDYAKALTEIGQLVSYMIAGEDGVFVEENIITAIWYVWYQKVQFTIKSERDKLHFLGRSFLFTSIELLKRIAPEPRNTKYWVKLWCIYNDIVNLSYGNVMSRDIENRSKTILAQMIADFELKSNTKIFDYIALGLTIDTAESDLFKKAYTENYINLQTQK